MPCVSLGRNVTTSTVTVLADNGSIGRQTFTVTVPSGKIPVSGGYDVPYATGFGHATLLSSFPNTAGTGWTFVFRNENVNHNVDLYVVYMDA